MECCQIEQQGDRCTITLGDEFNIYVAAEIKPKLLDNLSNSTELEINLSAVEELDTAGVQLLVLLKQESHRNNKALKLTGHSQATLEVLELIHLGNFFGDPLVLTD